MVTKKQISENSVTAEIEANPDRMRRQARQRPPIGQLLKTLRGSRTLRQVEADTGITNAYLSNLELGLKQPGIKTLAKLSYYYSVPMAHLLRVAGMEDAIRRSTDDVPIVDIQRAFEFVITDPDISHYQQPADILPIDVQKFVVQIYQHYTGRKLL